MRFELANGADEPGLRRLLRETRFPGAIELSFEREPCIDVANAIQGERHQTVVARPDANARVVAMGTRTLTTRYVNGVPTRIGYLGQLRVAACHRANPSLLRRGYAKLRELHADGAAPFYVTTIVSDNLPARRLLEAGLPGFPRYEHVDDLVTLTLPAAARRALRRAAAAPACDAELPAIVDCLARHGARHQFAPVWTLADLCSDARTRGLCAADFVVVRRGRGIAGCLACWDQRAFKQAVVRGYAPQLRALRPLANLLSPVTGTPKLPPIGASVAFAYLSHLAVDDNDCGVLTSLLAGALELAAARGVDYVSLGLSARSPIAGAILERFKARTYESRVYVAYWPDGAAAVQALDARPTHLETAIL